MDAWLGVEARGIDRMCTVAVSSCHGQWRRGEMRDGEVDDEDEDENVTHFEIFEHFRGNVFFAHFFFCDCSITAQRGGANRIGRIGRLNFLRSLSSSPLSS